MTVQQKSDWTINKQKKLSLLRKLKHLITFSISSSLSVEASHFPPQFNIHGLSLNFLYQKAESSLYPSAAAMHSKCSDCFAVDDGHSSGTCSEIIAAGDGGGSKGFMLFGVRVMMEGSFRKSASMNNLARFDQQLQDSANDVAAGYASDDVVHPSGRSRERKRGVPWSEEEHRLFLLGLQKVGKGDWRGISRNYVKTRTPTQVASHAQKYFLRRNNHHNRRRRRSSLFDIITTDAVVGSAIEEQMNQETLPQPPITQQQQQQPKPTSKYPDKFPMSTTYPITTENLTLGQQINQLNNSPKPIRPIPILPAPPPPSSKMANLNLNKTTTTFEPPSSSSLNLLISSQSPPPQPPPSTSNQQEPLLLSNQQSPRARHAALAFQAMPAAGFNGSGGDSIISVA